MISISQWCSGERGPMSLWTQSIYALSQFVRQLMGYRPETQLSSRRTFRLFARRFIET